MSTVAFRPGCLAYCSFHRNLPMAPPLLSSVIKLFLMHKGSYCC